MYENKYEKMMEKSEALAKNYAEKIGSDCHFGTDLFYMKAERALYLGDITQDTYNKMIDLAKAVHVSWSFSGIPNVKVQDFRRLERILDGKPGDETDISVEMYINPLKKAAEEYKKKIGTDSKFGSRQWWIDLSNARDSGEIKEQDFCEMKSFTEKNNGIIGQEENAKKSRWAVLSAWTKEVSSLYDEAEGKKISANTIEFFKNMLQKDKFRLSERRYIIIYMAFKDIENMEQSAFYDVQDELTTAEKEQKAKGRSMMIWLLIQILVPVAFGIGCHSLILGIALWGLCATVILPLQLIGGVFVADAVAEAVTFDGTEELSDEYKQMKAATTAGVVLGGIHAGIGAASELRKPGWIKDSK